MGENPYIESGTENTPLQQPQNTMPGSPEITIVTETFNLEEGHSVAALCEALFHISKIVQQHGNGEIILADCMEANLIVDSILQKFPHVRHLHAPGLGYEGVKNLAAEQASGRFIIYLDSDCTPASDAWLEALLSPLREGVAAATAGITRYRGNSLLEQVMSVLDFGFLIADERDIVGCYASNNCAFVRDVRLAVPAPDGPMRCTCYAHAQQLIRVGLPMHRAANALVLHELPPVFKERWRRGYDLVAACWINPALAETRWLRWGVMAAPRFAGANLREDWQRLGVMRRTWGWHRGKFIVACALAGLLRLIDLGGAAKALAFGPDPRWAAYSFAAKP